MRLGNLSKGFVTFQLSKQNGFFLITFTSLLFGLFLSVIIDSEM